MQADAAEGQGPGGPSAHGVGVDAQPPAESLPQQQLQQEANDADMQPGPSSSGGVELQDDESRGKGKSEGVDGGGKGGGRRARRRARQQQQEGSQQLQQSQQEPEQPPDFVPQDLPPGTVIENADTAPQPQDYVFVGDLRLVKPYFFDFKCFVKARQDGRPLMQLMAEEFPVLSTDYYHQAVACGRLRVEPGGSGGKGAKGAQQRQRQAEWRPEWPLRSGMCIRHFIHRHEPPVLGGDVQILGVTDDFVAVNKPACVPVHTVGQYRKNTVMGIVQAARPDLWPLYPTYRLDKPVSGVLLLARSSAVAARMRVLLEERSCSKAYVARVEGVFPDTDTDVPEDAWQGGAAAAAAAAEGGASGGEGAAAGGMCGPPSGGTPLVVDVPLGWEAKTNHATPVPDDPEARSRLPPELLASAKPAVTHFRRLSVAPDGRTSVVEAVPLTGRTHQIRVHLQHLGHPIANDTQYGGTYGLPLFFRRGMGGPTRPHVNGQRRLLAGEQAGSAAGEAGGSAPAPHQQEPPQQEELGGQQGQGQHGPRQSPSPKRQRCCSGAAGGSDGGPDAAAQPAQGRAPGPARASTDAPPGAHSDLHAPPHAALGAGPQPAAPPELPMGPNVDPALIAASSARYLALYTQPQFQVAGGAADPLCPHCPCLVPEGYPIDLEPLWLHARRYACGSEWCFEAPLPGWARPSYTAERAGAAGAGAGGGPGAGEGGGGVEGEV